MIGKIRFLPDERWARMMAEYEARRARADRWAAARCRSVWARFPRLRRSASTGWEDFDLKPMDGVGCVIVEIEDHDEVASDTMIDVHTIGANAIVIDWTKAAKDPEYADDAHRLVSREYARLGYIEGERFCTIIDRLDDLIRENEKGAG